MQSITQAKLLEKLRYKGYVQRESLGSPMQAIGDFARKQWKQAFAPRALLLDLLYLVYVIAEWAFWP